MNTNRHQYIKIFLCVSAVIVGIGLGGCASFGTYAKDRGNDFADCFKGDVGYGLGVDAHVMATDFMAAGAGASYTRKIGFKGRHTGSWKSGHISFPFIQFWVLYALLTEKDPAPEYPVVRKTETVDELMAEIGKGFAMGLSAMVPYLLLFTDPVSAILSAEMDGQNRLNMA